MNWSRRNGFDNWHAAPFPAVHEGGLTMCGVSTVNHTHRSRADPLQGGYCPVCVRSLLADLRQRLAEAEQDRDEGAAALVKVTQERDSLDQDLADKEAGERWHNGPRDPEV